MTRIRWTDRGVTRVVAGYTWHRGNNWVCDVGSGLVAQLLTVPGFELVEPDDLTQIDGIGAARADELLLELGIASFDDLAAAAAVFETVESGQHIVAIDNESGRQQQYHALPKAALMQQQIEQPEEAEHEFAHLDSTQIFEIIYQATLGEQNCPSLIVTGEKRSGKSTLLEYFTHAYAAEIDFVVIDPKQPDPKIGDKIFGVSKRP